MPRRGVLRQWAAVCLPHEAVLVQQQQLLAVSHEVRLVLVEPGLQGPCLSEERVHEPPTESRHHAAQGALVHLVYRGAKGQQCLEGLTLEELGQKWDPEIAQIIQAPGGPFARAGEA